MPGNSTIHRPQSFKAVLFNQMSIRPQMGLGWAKSAILGVGLDFLTNWTIYKR
jgi:hypothetical protein